MPVTASDILARLREDKVKYLRLQFTDITGRNKNVEVPESQFQKALDGECMFDGSSIQGFVRIEESDMLLKPDLDTYRVFPWEEIRNGKVARLICDVATPDDKPFEGCPRTALKRQVKRTADMGYMLNAGVEAEFFLFDMDSEGAPTVNTHDKGGYFDLTPVDLGEDCRRDIVEVLVEMGFEVEAAHHEVAPGQHEIDFKYADAVSTSDNLTTFKMVVRKIALDHGLHATFMPKPIFGENGSGMHTHQSLFYLDQSRGAAGAKGNAFFDPATPWQLSEVALNYIGGLLKHACALVAVTNPLVNSYKRLVPGYEAPVNVAWSEKNRSPMIRIPAKRSVGTRCELRMPDPSCNPYLALACMMAAGLDGIENTLPAGEPTNENIFVMTPAEKARRGISALPRSLFEAIGELKKDTVIQTALGTHLYQNFVAAKEQEWADYISQVHAWEHERYLTVY